MAADWQRDALEEIPVLDLADYRAGRPGAREALAAALAQAQQNIGFYYIRNHGVPQTLVDRMFDTVAAFHAQPLDEKLRLRIGQDQVGYLPMGGTVVTTGELNRGKQNLPDRSEAFWVRRERAADDPELGLRFRAPNQWPANLPGFRETTIEYMTTMAALGAQLLPLYAVALGLPPDWFAGKFAKADLVCRLGHYPPGDDMGPNQYGAGPHTDAGFLTLLPQAAVPGLEILTQSDRWVPAPVRPGEILVNGGDCLVRFTNGRFLATRHRVVSAIPRDRYSIPLFFNPAFDAVIAPVPTCTGPERPPLFEPITYYDYILWYLAKNYPHQAKAAATA